MKDWKGKKRPSNRSRLQEETEEALMPYNRLYKRIKGVEVYCDLCHSYMDGKDFSSHQCVDTEDVVATGTSNVPSDLESLLFSP